MTAFKPSFPNPEKWTEPLIRQRMAEFAAFQKTPEGIAEERAFDRDYAVYETNREQGCRGQAHPSH